MANPKKRLSPLLYALSTLPLPHTYLFWLKRPTNFFVEAIFKRRPLLFIIISDANSKFENIPFTILKNDCKQFHFRLSTTFVVFPFLLAPR